MADNLSFMCAKFRNAVGCNWVRIYVRWENNKPKMRIYEEKKMERFMDMDGMDVWFISSFMCCFLQRFC